MSKNNYDTVFDVGSKKISICSFFKDTDTVYYNKKFSLNKIVNFDFDFDLNEESIENMILDIEKNNKEHLNEILLMIDLSKMFPISFNIFKLSDQIRIDTKLINRLILDAKQEIEKNYKDHEILHIVVSKYNIDDKNYDVMPKNVICKKISIDLVFINIPNSILIPIKKIFSKFNVSIKKVICSSYAKSNFYLNKLEHDGQIFFIDIGYDKTSIFYFNKKKFCNYKIIPIGSKHITSDISKILNIDYEFADKIKDNFDNDKFILNNKKLSFELIRKIIFSRVEEILELSTKMFEDQSISKMTKLVFFGNGSKILDNKYKTGILFDHNIDLLEEEELDICKAGLNLFRNENNQEVKIISKSYLPEGIFEKFFNFFR